MNDQRWLSQNYFVFFITWGVFLPYWTGWLVQAKGMDVTEASLIMGFGLVARGASTLLGFPILYKYWSSHRVILFLTVMSLAATVLYIPTSSFSILLLVTIVFNAVYPALLPAIESAAGVLVQQGNVHYGKSRLYGSVGFVVSVFIISLVTGLWGEQAILWSMVVGLSFVLIMSSLPTPAVLVDKPVMKTSKETRSLRGLWKVKSFPIVLLIVVLLQGAHASYYNYGYIYLQDLDVSTYYIGIILNVAVIFEIFYFAKADHWCKNLRTSSLLLIAAAGSTLRWLLAFVFPNVWVFILSQSLHAVSFGVAHFAFIRYVTDHLPKQQIPNAQGLYSALALSWSTAILTVAGGFLYDIAPGLSFLGMCAFTGPAILMILATRKHYAY